MIHEPHTILLGYDKRQIFFDGCRECESRGANPIDGMMTLDSDRFARAWHRAAMWNDSAADDGTQLGETSEAERPLLELFWRFQVALERHYGLPVGELPYTGGRRDEE